jgi:hypothetical protein
VSPGASYLVEGGGEPQEFTCGLSPRIKEITMSSVL